MTNVNTAISRVLAVLALGAALLAVILVVGAAGGEDPKPAANPAGSTKSGSAKKKKKKAPKTYVVKEGDSLGAIAAQTGVDQSEIERLNEVDPQALIPGQKLRLR